MKSVYPSGSARAASAAARLPPAPTLFSTTTDCPSSALRVLGQKARREVGAASGGKRHHDANGPAWPALRQRPRQLRTSRLLADYSVTWRGRVVVSLRSHSLNVIPGRRKAASPESSNPCR